MLIHFPVQWKSTQHCKATIPQLKKKKKHNKANKNNSNNNKKYTYDPKKLWSLGIFTVLAKKWTYFSDLCEKGLDFKFKQ